MVEGNDITDFCLPFASVNPSKLASGLPSLVRSSLCLSWGLSIPSHGINGRSHPVIFFFCGWICCSNTIHLPYNAFAGPPLVFTLFGFPISVSS